MSKTLKSDFDRAYSADKSKKQISLSKQDFEKLVLIALRENDDISQNDKIMEELKKLDYVSEFPEDMYGAVAEILAFIFSMDAKKKKEAQNAGENNA